jgi:hypothetical protein
MDSLVLSKTRMRAFMQCPEKYRLGYILELQALLTSSGLLEGILIHELVETCLTTKNWDRDALEVAAVDAWAGYKWYETDYESRKEMKHAMSLCIDQVMAVIDEIKITPEVTEKHLLAPVVDVINGENLDDVVFQGFIDIVDQINGCQRAIDIKSAARTPDANAEKLSLELTGYAYLLAHPNFNRDHHPVAYLFLVRTKTPRVVWQEGVRTLEDFTVFFQTAKHVASCISDRRFWLNPGVHCNWCDYLPFCVGDAKEAVEAFGEEAWDLFQTTKAA